MDGEASARAAGESDLDVVSRLAQALETTVEELMLRAPAAWFAGPVEEDVVVLDGRSGRTLPRTEVTR